MRPTMSPAIDRLLIPNVSAIVIRARSSAAVPKIELRPWTVGVGIGIGVATASAIVIDPLRPCLATNTESDRGCEPDSDADADTDSGSSTAVFLHVGAHPAHELLSLRGNRGGS